MQSWGRLSHGWCPRTPPRTVQILCCPDICLYKTLIKIPRLPEVGRGLLSKADVVSFTALDLITGPCSAAGGGGKRSDKDHWGFLEGSGAQGSLDALKTHRLLGSAPSEVVSTAGKLAERLGRRDPVFM